MRKKVGLIIGICIFSIILTCNVFAREVIFEADDTAYACEVADYYGGRLINCFDGIAVMEISDNHSEGEPDNKSTVSDDGISTDNGDSVGQAELPVLYDNHVFDAEDTGTLADDPGYIRQWQHQFINLKRVRDYSRGDGVRVAVVDTGVNNTPDFEGTGIDFENAYSGITGETGAEAVSDLKNHGTKVAAIIAATADNGVDGTGIAPGATILPIKVAEDSGHVMEDALLRGIKRASELKADVINISIGGASYSALLEKYVSEATQNGVLVVCAAGNEGKDMPRYPAAFADTISVGALEHDEDGKISLAEYSQHGKYVDLAAPGSGLYTTDKNGSFVSFTGTSAAAPVVSATAALLISYKKELKNDPKAVKDVILNTAYQKEYVCEKNDGVVFRGINTLGALFYLKSNGNIPGVIVDDFHVKSENGKQIAGAGNFIRFKTESDGAEIYYTIDGKKPSVSSGKKYELPLELTEDVLGIADINGKHNIRAVAVIGNYASEVLNLKYDFIVKAEKVIGNNGNILYAAAGSRVLLNTVFIPSNTTNQNMDYTIVSGMGGSIVSRKYLKLDKSMKVGDSITVCGKTTDGTNLSTDIVVEIVSEKASFIKLKNKKITILTEAVQKTDKIGVSCNLIENLITDCISTNIIFKSNKPEIINVSPQGIVTSKKSGKAVVLCVLNDGSGKKAKCKINAITPVISIDSVSTSSGFKMLAGRKYLNHNFKMSNIEDAITAVPIAAGGKIKLRAVLNKGETNRFPSNKKLNCKSDNPAIKVKNGAISVDKNAVSASGVITIEAADGFGAELNIPVRIYGCYKNWKFDSKKVEIKRSEMMSLSQLESHLVVVSSTDGIERCPYYELMSSKEDVVGFMKNSNEGYIVAAKQGKTKFTARPVDGTKTRAVISVSVKE